MMSNFYCEHCGAVCCDSPQGYTTGCQHYLPDSNGFRALLRQLSYVVNDAKGFVTRPLGCSPCAPFRLYSYGQVSLLDLWNAGQYTECESIVSRMASGVPY